MIGNKWDIVLDSEFKIEIKGFDGGSDSVKIMTIHKSKGLEYHICYFAGFSYSFNISDLNDRFMFSEKYGIICPYFKDGIGETIYKSLLRRDYLKDEISEKIRLFYVALTRCKEKMILVCNLENKEVIYNNLVVDTKETVSFSPYFLATF